MKNHKTTLEKLKELKNSLLSKASVIAVAKTKILMTKIFVLNVSQHFVEFGIITLLIFLLMRLIRKGEIMGCEVIKCPQCGSKNVEEKRYKSNLFMC